MTLLRRAAVLPATVLLVLGLSASAVPALADPPAPPGTPTAQTVAPDPSVGPIFRNGLAQNHSCTGSVLASPARDLILTAAHCVRGTAAGWLFAPGYDDGATPYGAWTVTAAYVDPQWEAGQDTRFDYAILRVAPRTVHGHRQFLNDVVRGNVLGVAPRTGEPVTDIAYNGGLDDRPIRCRVPSYRTAGYPSFNCHGYVGGSSGSPWLTRQPGIPVRFVSGVIGGLHQGGCYEYTSYSSPFTIAVYGLLWRAVTHARPDDVPAAGSDGC